jgi:hypothetical protein
MVLKFLLFIGGSQNQDFEWGEGFGGKRIIIKFVFFIRDFKIQRVSNYFSYREAPESSQSRLTRVVGHGRVGICQHNI